MAGKLTRNIADKKIAGVCAGLADHFGMDVTLVRIIWVCLLLFAGTGLLAYLVMWILMPAR